MDWVGSKEESRSKSPDLGHQQQPSQHREESGCDGVADNIAQVVAPGVQASQQVVEPEGEHTQGSVGLVGSTVQQWGPPEVVVEQVPYWGLWQQVWVLQNSSAGKRRQQA